MFISIPKEFFVPVLFRDRFTLNLENKNMEYDTEKINIIKTRYMGLDEYNPEEEKTNSQKKINSDKSRDGAILDEADEEFVNSEKAEG